mmetsp:Transcript_8182/g.17871  ORF Transcript_8182/g.17871 Transcript_8182/m.17871 type:complete len:107 (+) Transcript_8182:82-402(+)
MQYLDGKRKAQPEPVRLISARETPRHFGLTGSDLAATAQLAQQLAHWMEVPSAGAAFPSFRTHGGGNGGNSPVRRCPYSAISEVGTSAGSERFSLGDSSQNRIALD